MHPKCTAVKPALSLSISTIIAYAHTCMSVQRERRCTAVAYLQGSQVSPPGQSSSARESHSRGEQTQDSALATATESTTMPPSSTSGTRIFPRLTSRPQAHLTHCCSFLLLLLYPQVHTPRRCTCICIFIYMYNMCR